jgi:polyhydroxyalkanoate synthesis regulator phasin
MGDYAMAKILQWKGLVDDGKRVAEVRSSRARQLASDCRAHGEHATHQASAAVEELLERRHWRSDELGGTVRATMQRALGALGLATKDDVSLQGALVTERVCSAVEELGVLARPNDELHDAVCAEVQRQVGALGLATKDDVSLQGALVTERVCSAVEELGVLARPNDELHDAVCAEVQRQVGALGVAIKDDLHALERRLTQTATRASSARRAAERGNKVGDERASCEEAAGQDAGSSDPTDGHPPSTLTTRPL